MIRKLVAAAAVVAATSAAAVVVVAATAAAVVAIECVADKDDYDDYPEPLIAVVVEEHKFFLL